jgi:hypothetical protein
MYWVAHAHNHLIIMCNGGDGDEYHVWTCPLVTESPSMDLMNPLATPQLSALAGRDMWTPLVHCDVGVIEDLRVYKRHLVLSCREKGLPKLRVAKLEDLPMAAAVRVAPVCVFISGLRKSTWEHPTRQIGLVLEPYAVQTPP